MLSLWQSHIMQHKITFISNTSEITAGTRGASLGFGALKVAALNQHSNLFSRPIINVKDVNHYLLKPTAFPFALRIDGLVELFKHLDATLTEVIASGSFPLVLAGDHGSAAGTLAALKKNFPKKRIGTIWIDAHADIHSPYTTPSGNMHGMPLAIALQLDNLDCAINTLDDATERKWEKLKNYSKKPSLDVKDLVYIAVRDVEEQEVYLLKKHNIKNFEVAEVNEKGTSEIVKATLDLLKDCDIIYVSFDVDSMDPAMTSHGTGTPVNNGLSPQQAEELLLGFAKSDKLVCLEFVEVNPCLDECTNKMAEITFGILENVVTSLEKK